MDGFFNTPQLFIGPIVLDDHEIKQGQTGIVEWSPDGEL
jgi:hypothetical protein